MNYGSEELAKLLDNIGQMWNLDIGLIQNFSGHTIYVISSHILNKLNLFETLNIPITCANNLFKKLEKEYKQNPYHNACHAADVMHSMQFLLNNNPHIYTDSFERLEGILAALAHDVGHPGVTNRFLINTRDPLAI